MNIRERLIKIRSTNDKTQAQMAQSLHVGRSTYACWENGSREIKDRYIDSICKEYGINESWFRNGTGEMLVLENFGYDLGVFANKATELDKLIIKKWIKLDAKTRKSLLAFIDTYLEDENGGD